MTRQARKLVEGFTAPVAALAVGKNWRSDEAFEQTLTREVEHAKALDIDRVCNPGHHSCDLLSGGRLATRTDPRRGGLRRSDSRGGVHAVLGAKTAEGQISAGLILAIVAIITVLPKYAVDAYYAWRAGQEARSNYVYYAAANMTGGNRLLVGIAWPLLVLPHWCRSADWAILLAP